MQNPSHPDARVVILGGGLTGISTAFHLRRPWLLVEKEARLGGHARTDETRGFHFDKTGHWLHLRDPYMKQLVQELLPGELVPVARKARIFSHGVLTRYPFQGNLHGLPPEVVSECLIDFVRAHNDPRSSEPAKNFEDFCLKKFGAGISRHFMIPYNQKLWGVHPREITAEWCSRFVPIPKLEDVIKGAVGDVPPEIGYNVSFLYPRTGGIETLTRALVARLSGGEVALSTPVEKVNLRERTINIGGDTITWRALVATLPLPELVARLVDAPKEIEEAAAKLRCTPVRYLNVATKSSPRADFHWIYVPEEKFPFYRVGIYTNAVPAMAPPGRGSLYVELSDRGPMPKVDDIMPDVAQALAAAGAINGADDVLFAEIKELKYAYVVFDDNYYSCTDKLIKYFEANEVYPRGRYGSWIYNAMEDSILAGREVALRLSS
ncbi:MAG TPA: FAD-dependent oxidoreductase [Polyangia bacterium]|nr:FAD-dependent oxidoreductase [Polyangia bacterium]